MPSPLVRDPARGSGSYRESTTNAFTVTPTFDTTALASGPSFAFATGDDTALTAKINPNSNLNMSDFADSLCVALEIVELPWQRLIACVCRARFLTAQSTAAAGREIKALPSEADRRKATEGAGVVSTNVTGEQLTPGVCLLLHVGRHSRCDWHVGVRHRPIACRHGGERNTVQPAPVFEK
jgi:hypothetical protein